MAYSAYLKSRVIAFVSSYGNDLIKAIKGTNLYFPAVVAQKCLESGYCSSDLCSKYNNFAGVRNFGHLDNAGTVYLVGHGDTTPQPYATYASPLIAFESYVRILQDPNQKYTSVGVFTATSPEQQILRIVQAGYDPTNTPQQYLSSLQPMLDCTRDVYKFGKVG